MSLAKGKGSRQNPWGAKVVVRSQRSELSTGSPGTSEKTPSEVPDHLDRGPLSSSIRKQSCYSYDSQLWWYQMMKNGLKKLVLKPGSREEPGKTLRWGMGEGEAGGGSRELSFIQDYS